MANSGNANACTGAQGLDAARRMCRAAARVLGARERQVLVCSTGRIGVQMPIAKMEAAMPRFAGALGPHGRAAAEAIMTSDSFAKEIAVECQIGGKPVRIGGIAKGAGMIDPNMATMLCFVTTDAAIGEGRPPAGAVAQRGAILQPHYRGWRHEHQRHRAGPGQRARRARPPRRERAGCRAISRKRSTT